MKEPIKLRLYFSRKLAQSYPFLLSYASRVEELLNQYENNSNGKIIVQIINVEPFSVLEDEALNHGLQGISVDGSGNEIYFGVGKKKCQYVEKACDNHHRKKASTSDKSQPDSKGSKLSQMIHVSMCTKMNKGRKRVPNKPVDPESENPQKPKTRSLKLNV